MQLTLSRIWYFAAHPRPRLRDRVIAGMWRAGEDTGAICDLLLCHEYYLYGRVRDLRNKGMRLAKRTRHESCAKRTTPVTERACLRCRAPFPSEGAGHRICDTCKDGREWRNDVSSMAV